MFTGFFAVFLTSLCTLYFTLPRVLPLSVSEFDGFSGERICTDPNTHYKPADYCSEINREATHDCSSLNLHMSNAHGGWDLYVREVVACREKNVIFACISGGKTDEHYIIWSYSYPQPITPNSLERCFHPQEFKIQEATAVEGTSTSAGQG